MAKKAKAPSKRIGAALSRWLKKQNPGAMKGVTHVRVKKLKGGGVTVTPARINPAKEFNVQYQSGGVWRHAGTVYAATAKEAMKYFHAGSGPIYQGMKLRVRRGKT